MRPVFRNIIFASFATTFLIAAPLLVLYTAGYRYNTVNGHIVRTGVLTVSSLPRGAAVIIPNYAQDKNTPAIFSRIMPGNYPLMLRREAYHDWETNVTVESGRTTALGEVILFRDQAPMLIAAKNLSDTVPSPAGTKLVGLVREASAAAVWLIDLADATSTMVTEYPAKPSDVLQLSWSQDGSLITLANQTSGVSNIFALSGAPINDPVTTAVSPFVLVKNNQAVELHDARTATQPLIGFLPLADYKVAEVDNNQVVLTGSDRSIYVVDVTAKNPILLSAKGTIYDFAANAGLFAWSDGIEIHTFNLASQQQTFITRQSKAIISVAWHDSGRALIVSTNDDVRAFELSERKIVTPLLSDATIFSFWLNAARDTGYFYGEYQGTRGVFTLPITK